jgi:5-methylcytosine-specific restriction endonuclease McrA
MDIDPDSWQHVLDFYEGRCAYGCGRWAQHREHVIPKSRGGSSEIYNLVPSCEQCNYRKSTSTWVPDSRHPFMSDEHWREITLRATRREK